MGARKHCRFLRMITVRVSRDEHHRIKRRAMDSGISINVLARRGMGLQDEAIEVGQMTATNQEQGELAAADQDSPPKCRHGNDPKDCDRCLFAWQARYGGP
jgi:hypothetical protein